MAKITSTTTSRALIKELLDLLKQQQMLTIALAELTNIQNEILQEIAS